MSRGQGMTLSAGQEMRLFAGLSVQPFAAAILGFVAFPIIDLTGRALYGGTTGDATRAAISIRGTSMERS